MSKAMRRILLGIALATLMLASGAGADEFRAFWADAWHDGLGDSSEVAAMVNTAKNNNFNVIVVQVRKRGDAYYMTTLPNIEPHATDIPGNYDALADVITQAHAQGLKVHAWMVCNLIWSDSVNAPTSSNHVYKKHPEWLMKNSSGQTYISEGYYLDPGVPDAMTWNFNVAMDLVQHYNIDGLHLDYIRYPQQDSGYNDIAISRFNAEYGRTGIPSSSDATFSAWRRRQLSDFVRRVYVCARAYKPNIVLGAATFASRSDAYTYRFQDWAGWMNKGYLDANMPMNYATDNGTYYSRTDDAVNNKYGRHVYMGQACYMNTISNSMTQLNYVRNNGCEGMCTFSYQATNSESKLNSVFYSTLKTQLFPTAVSVPTMPWRSAPTQGLLKGTVTDSSGTKIYNASISAGTSTELSDGSGFYAFTKLNPGTYNVICQVPGYLPATGTVTITAGQVSTLDFTVSHDTTPPVISSVTSGSVYANSATITWTTDEQSSSQVEYGPTASYGYETAQNTALVTSHSVTLTGLAPNTTYHYRVKSADGSANQSVSGDYTFTTSAPTNVADIIIDNVDPEFSIVSSWSTSSSSTDKYGSDYRYATTASTETRSARWTPNIITPGNYEVSVWYPAGSNRTAKAPYTVYYNGGSKATSMSQQTNGGQWNLLGTYTFSSGNSGSVKLSNNTGESSINVMADAVKWHFVGDSTPPSIMSISTSNITQTQCTITWSTDEPSDARVEYGTTASYGESTTRDAVLQNNHTVTLTGLAPGTTYHFRVLSADAFSNLMSSDDQTFTTLGDTTPPVISNVIAVDISDTGATIQWDTDESADSQVDYGLNKFYGKSTALDSSMTTVHGVQLTGLTPNTIYHYRVKSKDAYGNQATSVDKSFRTEDLQPPVFAGLASAADTMIDGASVDLSWDAVSDDTPPVSYLIYMATTPGGEDFNSPLAETADPFYTVTGLTLGQTYYFVVRAKDSADPPNVDKNTIEKAVTLSGILVESGLDGRNFSYYHNQSGMGTVAYEKSTAPGCSAVPVWEGHPLYVSGGTINRATFTPPVPVRGLYRLSQSWGSGAPNCRHARYATAFDGGTTDVVYLDQIGSGQSANANQWLECATAPVPLPAGTSAVITTDDSENQGPAHDLNTGKFYTDALRLEYLGPALDAPSGLSATAGSSSIALSWSAVTGASGYKIYRSTASGAFSFTPIGMTNGTSFTDSAATPGTTYYYLVRATNASGYAGFASNEASASVSAYQTYSTSGKYVKYGRWNLISVPADPVNSDPLSVFSGINVANASFQYWRNDVDGGGYIGYGPNDNWFGPIMRGTPYWFMEAGNPDMGSDKDISFTGLPPTGDFELIIPAHQSGPFWVMLGMPFSGTMPANSVQFKNVTKRGDTWLTWQEAFSEADPSLRIVDSNLQGWNVVSSGFVSVAPPPWMGDTDLLREWCGYWLLVYDKNELRIKFPKP